jgi:RNA polymerase sigma-70 factor (ECF subfamily)
MGFDDAGRTCDFDSFVAGAEQRLRRALVASYGPIIGRDATVDALSWAWEHWDRIRGMDNPVGYLYRVGQSASARYLSVGATERFPAAPPPSPSESEPELAGALGRLSVQQRAVVVLVHGYAMSQREAADVMGISVSTVREHLDRGMGRLRNELEVSHGQ